MSAARVVVAFAILCTLCAPSFAAGRPASFVIDANTGSVISAFNADEPRYPASLTKMMTLYITFDLMQQGRLKENSPIRMSVRAASAHEGRLKRVGRREGVVVTDDDAPSGRGPRELAHRLGT